MKYLQSGYTYVKGRTHTHVRMHVRTRRIVTHFTEKYIKKILKKLQIQCACILGFKFDFTENQWLLT